MKTTAPIQYTTIGRMIKKFLHTQLGARIGYTLGISGFNRIEVEVRDANGNLKSLIPSFNSRVNKGGDLAASLLAGTSFNSIASPLPPKYIALSTSTLTPAAGDTTLTGETSASGLARALGTQGSYTTPSVLDGACSYTVTKTFTSGATATINSVALFDASSSGNMFVEANLSASASLVSGDQLTINWTVNL